jgi:predicted aspartyl protease
MIAGQVTDDGQPTIRMTVAGRSWIAVVDSGFNGDLELPEVLRAHLNIRFRGREPWLLASGQSIEEDIYSVEFPFDGQTVYAEASFVSGDTILVGTGMLSSYRLTIDFPARTVLLERAA